MLLVKIILSTGLYLYNRSQWGLSLFILLSNPIIELFNIYFIDNNFLLTSDNFLLKMCALLIYCHRRVIYFYYILLNDLFNKFNIYDDPLVNHIIFYYNKLKNVDDSFKFFIVSKFIDGIKMITLNMIIYIKNNPEKVQLLLNRYRTSIDLTNSYSLLSKSNIDNKINDDNIDLHQIIDILQYCIKIINYINNMMKNNKVKTSLNDINSGYVFYLEKFCKTGEQKINLFLTKCIKQQEKHESTEKIDKTDTHDEVNDILTDKIDKIDEFNSASEDSYHIDNNSTF